MLPLPTYFDDFLQCIRPTAKQREDYKKGHKLLRERLLADEELKSLIVSTFLQGSYRRATAVRPKDESRPDVDVVVVTNIESSKKTPQQAIDLFKPFLEKHYKGSYKQNDRSFQIELSLVKLDLVITAKPSDEDLAVLKSAMLLEDDSIEDTTVVMLKASSDDAWKAHPLLIPDSRIAAWQSTHPLEQIRWTWDKNRACAGHYVNVVKAIKWWRKVRHTTPQYPKGYPLEHLIGQCCPDGVGSVAEGVTRTLEEIASRYKADVLAGRVPYLKDHGVDQNVMHRVTVAQFAEFHGQVEQAAKTARDALDETSRRRATEKWRKLFGEKFPLAEEDVDASAGGAQGGFTPRSEPSRISGGRYA
jgi:Second Messenger Oligonucleotide or Dinucleotide Synthetase domain